MRNASEEGSYPSCCLEIRKNTNRGVLNPLHHREIKETQTRRVLNPPYCADMKEIRTRRVLTSAVDGTHVYFT